MILLTISFDYGYFSDWSVIDIDILTNQKLRNIQLGFVSSARSIPVDPSKTESSMFWGEGSPK